MQPSPAPSRPAATVGLHCKEHGMETSRFRKSKDAPVDVTDAEARIEALTAELRAVEAQKRQLELDLEQLRSGGGSIDQAGVEVATVLRAFAQTVETARADAERRAEAKIAEAEDAARAIREAAEEEAHRLRVAAQDAHDQGLQGLQVARTEAKRVWEEA